MSDEEASETRADLVYKVLRFLEERNNDDPVKSEALFAELRTRELSAEVRGKSLNEGEVSKAIALLVRRNLLHETEPGLYSTYLEPEDLGPAGQTVEELVFELADTMKDLTETFESVWSLYNFMIFATVVGGIAFLIVALVAFWGSSLMWGLILSALLLWVMAFWAYIKRGAFDELRSFRDSLLEDMATLKFGMGKPEGSNTQERLLNLLAQTSYYSERIQRIKKEYPEAVKLGDEVEGKSGKKYRFDVRIFKRSSVYERLRGRYGLHLLVKIYDKEVTEDDLEELADALLDISEKVGYTPHQIMVVSKAGFTRRAYGWANRESNMITLDPDNRNARSTPIELVQEAPDGSFKIVSG